MKEGRNSYFDFLRGFLILLVLLGHAIQYGSGSEYLEKGLYWNNGIMKGIYSFHMPLFILISGYFLYFSFEKYGILKTSIKKCKKLLLPIITWVPIVFCLDVVIGNDTPSIKKIIYVFLTDFWFLWAILYCTALLSTGEKMKRKWKIIFYVFVQIIFFFTPDILWANAYKFVFPFFLLGFYLAKTNFLKQLLSKRVLLCSLFGWLLLLAFYSKESYIYTTGYTLLRSEEGFLWYRQLAIDIYRVLVGIMGCIFWLALIKTVWNKLENGGVSFGLVNTRWQFTFYRLIASHICCQH